MPVDRQAGVQLFLLLLVVPAQYIISQWMATSESQRNFAIKNLLTNAAVFKKEYLSWQSWQRWCAKVIHDISPLTTTPYFEGQDDPDGESPAVEVISHLEPKGHFAGSPEPRNSRPPEVKFRIGQVIKHKIWGYRGVIVGWDEIAKREFSDCGDGCLRVLVNFPGSQDRVAPDNWFKSNYPKGKEHWRDQPNYAILVDTRDRLTPQLTYVPQENIEIIINMQVLHPSIEVYFEKFDGAMYLPRPWLKAVYPQDS